MGDFNLALVIVAIVVCVIVFISSIYLLVNYQHPDDANQAYFPKFVVVFGLSVAMISILMLPADVANRHACRHSIYNGACNLTLPMKDLWLAVYIVDAVLVFFIIPFAMFFYEGDQDKSLGKRIKSALIWVVTTAVVCALVLGILYGVIGKVDFSVRHLSSATTSFPTSWQFTNNQPCIGNTARQCSAYTANAASEKTWTMRTTFPEYVVALATIVGSVLFTIFGGVGIACLPLGLITAFIRRPKAVITRSQYIKEATELGKKARELKKAADALHQEERSGAKGRKWRKNVKAVEKELLQLEEDVNLLEEVYPQGEKAETAWAFTVLGYLAKFILGILGLIVSVAWIAHIIIYLLVDPPLSPFLNEVFIKLDDVWGLLGTAAFAFFCFYLLLAVIAGAMMLGLKLVFVTIHPMKWGATLMNSFLFNVGLILLCSISVIQFCATAFGYYAQATAAQEIFGHTLHPLRGIKYLYNDGHKRKHLENKGGDDNLQGKETEKWHVEVFGYSDRFGEGDFGDSDRLGEKSKHVKGSNSTSESETKKEGSSAHASPATTPRRNSFDFRFGQNDKHVKGSSESKVCGSSAHASPFSYADKARRRIAFLEYWGDKGNNKVVYPKGSCTNCGAMEHDSKACFDRPKGDKREDASTTSESAQKDKTEYGQNCRPLDIDASTSESDVPLFVPSSVQDFVDKAECDQNCEPLDPDASIVPPESSIPKRPRFTRPWNAIYLLKDVANPDPNETFVASGCGEEKYSVWDEGRRNRSATRSQQQQEVQQEEAQVEELGNYHGF